MRIKNNSENSWMGYNAGRGNFIDIPAGEVIEVTDEVGKRLLHLLGSKVWLTVTDEPATYPKKKKEKQEVSEPEPEVVAGGTESKKRAPRKAKATNRK